jgi:hypothetical protein
MVEGIASTLGSVWELVRSTVNAATVVKTAVPLSIVLEVERTLMGEGVVVVVVGTGVVVVVVVWEGVVVVVRVTTVACVVVVKPCTDPHIGLPELSLEHSAPGTSRSGEPNRRPRRRRRRTTAKWFIRAMNISWIGAFFPSHAA